MTPVSEKLFPASWRVTPVPVSGSPMGSITCGTVVDEHPTIRTLALAFLILIGMSLVAESLDFHVPKGYLYFAMAFSVFVEMLNLRVRSLRHGYAPE